MNKDKNKIPVVYTSILYLLGLFLFLEWLYPVEKVTDTSNLTVFVIFTFFCFIITLLQVHWLISFLLKGFGILFIINGLYSDYGLFSRPWFEQLIGDFSYNVQMLMSLYWYDLSGMFRSILFLVIIWLMSYLIHYWFVLMKRIFIFVVLTFVYLAVLDTFTVYDAALPIIRVFIMSFIALGMANFFKEIQTEGIRFSWTKKNPIWVVPLVLIVLFSAAVGYASPKIGPQWPDPVPFIQGMAGSGSGGAGGPVQKVGYGEDDSRLGGSFVQDYTPVFQAAAKEEHYWRVESKDIYTGKGWTNSDSGYTEHEDGVVSVEDYGAAVETTRYDSTINFQGNTNLSKLVYPYGIQKVDKMSDGQNLLTDVLLLKEIKSGEINTQINNRDISLESYTLQYDYPSFPLVQLKESTGTIPEEIMETYTQLPESLPERVGELAFEITAAYDSQYDKVAAVESYFGRNGYVYQTSNVPVPEEEQDYVDQFLFDSQVGYCDNFSTSMVVMLRTQNIPARWVKGFTSGEKISHYADGDTSYDLYEVTNANAHSWVEVYFAEIGWVPFEPTQGFDNPAEFYTDTDGQNQEEEDPLQAPEQELETPEEEPEPLNPEELEQEEAQETFQPSNGDDNNNISINWWVVGFVTVIVGLIAILIYWRRYQLAILWLTVRLRRKGDAYTFQDAYHFILKLLQHKGMKKEPNQTLREYAKQVDTWYHTDAMGRLTLEYEKLVYRNDVSSMEVSEMKGLWKNLIKEILG